MCPSRSRLSPLGQIAIERCIDLLRDTFSPYRDIRGPSSVTEAHVSIMHTFVHCLRSINYTIASPQHTTPM